MFRVRIIKVDHYSTAPIPEVDVTYSDFRKSKIKSVPVIRLFGTTPNGIKTCVHIHGVFPYICIPYDGTESHLKLGHQLAASLDKAINIASGYSTSTNQHVYKVLLVSGIPFYGYHRKRHQFLKVYFYKPSVIKQATSLLQSGAVLNKIFQPHEAHIPFILQFFIDFNLYGMSFIDFEHVKFRRNDYPELLAEVSPELILPEAVQAVSVSQLEVDALASHITNRPSSQGNGQLSNPGLAAIWEDEHKRRAGDEGTPLKAPPLHSQRPLQKQTSSELFFLRRIEGILINPSQAADDTSLSGETMASTNKSYAIEEPAVTEAIDASLISFDEPEARSGNQVPLEVELFDETIVDEDLALMNLSLSQRVPQALDKIVTNYEDLELLDALETLANNRSVTVDNDSVLGSQTIHGKSAPCPSLRDADESSGEEEEWQDKTLVAEEDEVLKLFDLTMPDIDEAAILNNCIDDRNQSPVSDKEMQIPQVDGVIGDKKFNKPRKTFKIPQLDGVNGVPTKSSRKSLGMRGGRTRMTAASISKDVKDRKYSGSGGLIFKAGKNSSTESHAGPSSSKMSSQTPGASQNVRLGLSLKNNSPIGTMNMPSLDSDHSCARSDQIASDEPSWSRCDGISFESTAPILADVLLREDPGEPDVSSESNTENTPSESVVQSILLEHDALVCPLPLEGERPVVSCSALLEQSSHEELMLPYSIPLHEKEVVLSLQPHVACCSSANAGCSEDCAGSPDASQDCGDVFIGSLNRRVEEPVLRGDPSLYPDMPLEKELSDLITAAVCKVTTEGKEFVASTESCVVNSVDKDESIGSRVRRSSRHTSNEMTFRDPHILSDPLVPDKCEVPENSSEAIITFEDPEGSPCSCFDLGNFFDNCAPSTDWNKLSECSDIELNRLAGALANGHMEEILQTEFEESHAASTSSRRDELLDFLENQKAEQLESLKMECQGVCSRARARAMAIAIADASTSKKTVTLGTSIPGDPRRAPQEITEEKLLRGFKPTAGPPPKAKSHPGLGKNINELRKTSLGKDMKLAKLYCSKPIWGKTSPATNSSSAKQIKRIARQKRKTKLSLTAQRRKKGASFPNVIISEELFSKLASAYSLQPCSIVLEKLTNSNISKVCKKHGVKLLDKSAFRVQKHRSSTKSAEEPDVNVWTHKERSNCSVSLNKSKSPLDVSKSTILCGGRSKPVLKFNLTGRETIESENKSDLDEKPLAMRLTHLKSRHTATLPDDIVQPDKCTKHQAIKRKKEKETMIENLKSYAIRRPFYSRKVVALTEGSHKSSHHSVICDLEATNQSERLLQEKQPQVMPRKVSFSSQEMKLQEPFKKEGDSNVCVNRLSDDEVDSSRHKKAMSIISVKETDRQHSECHKSDIKSGCDISIHPNPAIITRKRLSSHDSNPHADVCQEESVLAMSSGLRKKRLSSSSSSHSSLNSGNTFCSEIRKKQSFSSSSQGIMPHSQRQEKSSCNSAKDKIRSCPVKSSVKAKTKDGQSDSHKVSSSKTAVKTDSEFDNYTIAQDTLEENTSKLLKHYKIPKKSNKMTLKLNSSPLVDGVSGGIPSLPTESAEKPENNDSSILSLDVSGISFNISSDGSPEGKTEPFAFKRTHVQMASCTSKPKLVGHGKTIYVDGAQTETSSDLSGGQSQGAHSALIRDLPSLSTSVSRNEANKCEEPAVLANSTFRVSQWHIPKINESELPASVARWFVQRYGPWSLWSPNNSPNDRHHAHMFSPPRPVSPDKSHFSGFPTGCMEEEEGCTLIGNQLSPPHNLSENLSTCSQFMKSKRQNIMFLQNQGQSAKMESNPDIEDSSSGKVSHGRSSPDIFSDKSLHADFENSDEEKQFIEHGVRISLNASPSSTICEQSCTALTSECSNSSEHEEGLLTPCKSQENSEACEELLACNSHLKSKAVGPGPESEISRESADLPCGQDGCTEKTPSYFLFRGNHFKSLQLPPSRAEVMKSLPLLNLPKVINLEPFCSKYSDVGGKIEVGGNVLVLSSKSVVHLAEFHSNIPGLCTLGTQQRRLFECFWGLSQIEGDFNQLMSHHSAERLATFAPVMRPPKVRDVVLWDKAKQIVHQRTNQDKKNEPTVSRSSESCDGTLIDTSFHSCGVKSQSEKMVKASTPQVQGERCGNSQFASPLLTPILQRTCSLNAKMPHTKSGKFLKSLPHPESPLLPVLEKKESDMGVKDLEPEVKSDDASSNKHYDHSPSNSSLHRLLLDSQFCQDIASPTFRHVSDASACQIKGDTASSGFKMNLGNLQTVKTVKEHQFMTVLTVEIHVCICGSLNPDPERDPIRAIFYSVHNDVPGDSEIPSQIDGIIAVNFSQSSIPLLGRCGIDCTVEYTNDEKSLLQCLISVVRKWDPDILAGFEIEMQSWGYLVQRASVLGINLLQLLSRISKQNEKTQMDDLEDNNGLGGLKIPGRIVLDVWRVFRSEAALQSYTFESLMYHILHERVGHHSFEKLSNWWEHPSCLYRWMTVRYYQQRVLGVMRLLDQLDIIGRTSELARLFGIQFFEVLSRGSQFRVESMMLRLAKPLNYIPLSPSVQQRAHMRAPECVPLIMEPESRFYNDPLIVLDFQSLYPSMIIAYNYCFSTCLGRVEHLGKSTHFEFGCSELRITNSHLQQLKDNITVSPSGVAFVTKAVRQGVLPKMLEEILEARLAVKQSMKHHKDDHTLQRVLHARQLGLKLIANVTYGYTSANFSGRMPCIEIGDSVVSKGRETLERAISLVHNNKQWQARVVYGDTDSLFVLVPGRSRQEAFEIGAEIASAVTRDNPSPVKLKLEKVYQPSILQTKKRYVGFMYESPDQKEPVYEAKGIETVRRDGCPAVAKMLEKTLRILFQTCDVSSVKNYVSHQLSKILAGRANIQDLIFAREYRGKENYRPGACVPALELTKRWLRHDRRAEPRIGERVPYVIVNGSPGSALIHLVRHPNELLTDSSLRYNAVYYITRAIIPPLSRCLSLLGVDLATWYAALPRKSQFSLPRVSYTGMKKTISQYFTTMDCVCCGDLTHRGVCTKCHSNPQLVVASLMSKLHDTESAYLSITKVCQSCLGRSQPLDCTSLDCPITYRRHQSLEKLEHSSCALKLLNEYFAVSSSG